MPYLVNVVLIEVDLSRITPTDWIAIYAALLSAV